MYSLFVSFTQLFKPMAASLQFTKEVWEGYLAYDVRNPART